MIKWIKNKWQLFICTISIDAPYGMSHKPLKIVKHLSKDADLIKCETCGREYAIHYKLMVCLPFDKDLKGFYESQKNE